jgi:hypothetical protein
MDERELVLTKHISNAHGSKVRCKGEKNYDRKYIST